MIATLLLSLLPLQDAPAAARAWRVQHEREILEEFVELLRIPNVSRDLPNIRRNAEWIVRALQKRGVTARLLELKLGAPAVYGEIETAGAKRTWMFYTHFDGQPVDRSKWTDAPFEPTLRSKSLADGGVVIPLPAKGEQVHPEARIYARSAGDDKAPVIALLAALDGLKAAGIAARANIKFFFEGEEEIGSINLRRMLHKNRELLAADAWIFCDGPVHQNRKQQVVFGVRGVTGLDLTVYGARRPLHSGHYGNWAPNPAMLLARLLASMKDDAGNVLVSGFYDDVAPLTAAERAALAAAPAFDDALKRELWLGSTEGNARLDAAINRPSLNVRGLSSAGVGLLARNIVPATARASIDIRLVKGMQHRRAVERVIAHIREQGYHVVEREPNAETRLAHARVVRVVRRRGYNALRTAMDSDVARRIVRAVASARGEVIRLPTLGGSLPLTIFDEVLKTPVVIVPIANHDNNQHAPDENLRLQNLWDGIETMAALLTME